MIKSSFAFISKSAIVLQKFTHILRQFGQFDLYSYLYRTLLKPPYYLDSVVDQSIFMKTMWLETVIRALTVAKDIGCQSLQFLSKTLLRLHCDFPNQSFPSQKTTFQSSKNSSVQYAWRSRSLFSIFWSLLAKYIQQMHFIFLTWTTAISSVVECPPPNWKVGSTAAEWIAATLLGQERLYQLPRQEAKFRVPPAANCR